MALKERISSPLEAGQSLLDAHHLPPRWTPALEYASSRLAKKSLHLTLVVVRRDYQLPSVIPPVGSPGLSAPTTPASPPTSKFNFAAAPVTALKQLVKSGSLYGSDSVGSRAAGQQQQHLNNIPSAVCSVESPGLRFKWPRSPTTPLSPPPMTPCTPSSMATDYLQPMTPGSIPGFRLIHADDLAPKTQRAQKAIMMKAAQKFGLGPLLSPAVSPGTCGLSNHLFHDSVIQNEILFSSEGLTLLSLDRLYSIKSALSGYSKTQSLMRLEDAVDELRRYVLANNGAKVTKSDLLRSYDWLSVTPSAISDLDQMYRRAYGGTDQVGAIAGMVNHAHSESTLSLSSIEAALDIAAEPRIRSSDEDDGRRFFEDWDEDDPELSPGAIGVAVTTVELSKPPTPRGPALKLQTSFEAMPKMQALVPASLPRSTWDHDDDEDNVDDHDVVNDDKNDEDYKSDAVGKNEDAPPRDDGSDGDVTARPLDLLPAGFTPWGGSTIDQVLSAGVSSPDRGSLIPGPMTPNGYDDISPITRGEWGFLMGDAAPGRTAAVGLC